MRSRTGQQMLEWTALRPLRPVAIDLDERDPEPTPNDRGRLAQHETTETVPGEPGHGRRVPDPAPRVGERRFRLECLSREQLIGEIIEINASATVAFLGEFDDTGLRRYLTRLRSTRLGRGRASVAERPAGTPAISAHRRRN
jgi:hypothetical protein